MAVCVRCPAQASPAINADLANDDRNVSLATRRLLVSNPTVDPRRDRRFDSCVAHTSLRSPEP